MCSYKVNGVTKNNKHRRAEKCFEPISRLSHLITNVTLQLILGVLLEIVHSWSRIAIIYFTAVVGGSLFITLLSPHNYVVGASAGVYGLLFSHLSTIILNWKEMDKKAARLCMLAFYIIVDVAMNLNPAPDDADVSCCHHTVNRLKNCFKCFSFVRFINRPIMPVI